MTPEETRIAVEVLVYDGQLAPAQQLQWIEDFHRVTHLVVNEGEHSANKPVFWLRLQGVLVELVGHLDDLVSWYSKGATNQGCLLGLEHEISLAKQLLQCCNDVRSSYSADELIYADYRRQVEAHLFQKGFRVRPAGGGKSAVKDTYTVKSLGKILSVAEIRLAISRVLLAHEGEAQIAVAFARRALPLCPLLTRAARAYCSKVP